MNPQPQLDQHNIEIELNRRYWDSKPLLQRIYLGFYEKIATQLNTNTGEGVLELGSGIGAIKTVLPLCQTSDIFPNPWLDRIESAYSIKSAPNSLNGLVLFDVWHHLEFPAVALKEFNRVLKPSGRVVLFEPAMGLLGRVMYGALHHEPLGFGKPIDWSTPAGEPPLRYYAAQGNAWRMFRRAERPHECFEAFDVQSVQVFSALGYAASGGFSKPQLYPTAALPAMRGVEKLLDLAPRLFGTRMMVTLVKKA